MSHPQTFTAALGSVAVPRGSYFFMELNQDPFLKPLGLGLTPGIQTRIFNTSPDRNEAVKSIRAHTGLAFHLLLAKFFLIWALTDSWMFLSKAVSPAILTNKQTSDHTGSAVALHPKECWNIVKEEWNVRTRGAAEPAHRCNGCWDLFPSGGW